MNSFSESTVLYLLLISNAFLAAAACVAIARFQKLIRDSREFWTSPTGAAIRTGDSSEAEAAKVQNAVSDKDLERRLTALQNLVARMAKSAPPETNDIRTTVPVDNAVRMVKQGASVNDLTRNCGLSIGEARLVHKLHGEKHRPAAQ